MVYHIAARMRACLPKPLLDRLFALRSYLKSYSTQSYSQEGEDMIVRRIFQERPTGFYVDIGAYHPKHLSNTYYFYQRGWHGINIDAMPGSMKLFYRLRPRDINIEAAIAAETSEKTFYVFNGRALNTLDSQLAEQRNEGETRLIEIHTVKTQRLDTILAERLPTGKQIQFMSIDVEGYDLEVLKSNDWSQFRPEYILVEVWDLELAHSASHPVVAYLAMQEYSLVGKAYSTAFFRDNRND